MNDIKSYLDTIFPDPKCELNYKKDYEFLIAVMLSAQTTDKRVNIVTEKLFKKYKNLIELSNAKKEDVIAIVKELGNFNKKSEAIIKISRLLLDDCNGIVPNDRTYLENLPMVGRKTTNVVLGELFNEPNIAVDTHVYRVAKRLNITNEKDDVLETEKKLKKKFKKKDWIKIHHQLVLFGRYYCTKRNPKCENCKLKDICKYKS